VPVKARSMRVKGPLFRLRGAAEALYIGAVMKYPLQAIASPFFASAPLAGLLLRVPAR